MGSVIRSDQMGVSINPSLLNTSVTTGKVIKIYFSRAGEVAQVVDDHLLASVRP
jgi:hypothetical protein